MENNGRSPSLLIFSRSPTVPQLGPLAEGTEGIVKAKLGVSFSPLLHAGQCKSPSVLVTLSAAISNI